MRATKNLKLNALIPITRIFAGVVQIVALFLSVLRFFVFRIYIYFQRKRQTQTHRLKNTHKKLLIHS